MKSFYIITNACKDPNLVLTGFVQKYLEQHGKKCYVHTQNYMGSDSYTDAAEIPDEVECVLVLGGDGTLLQAARDIAMRDIPLLGINLGTLGYLAEVDSDNVEAALQHLVKDEYETEQRMMLSGTTTTGDSAFALNDIVISRSGSLKVIHYHIYVNGQFLKGYSADGIIIATPTGSTGYNLSAGGPIVEPKAQLMVLTPICPHTLNTRSIVLSAEDEIEIEICEGRDGGIQTVEVNFDGAHCVALKTGDRIRIKRSSQETKILKLSKLSFLEVLHRKMSEV